MFRAYTQVRRSFYTPSCLRGLEVCFIPYTPSPMQPTPLLLSAEEGGRVSLTRVAVSSAGSAPPSFNCLPGSDALELKRSVGPKRMGFCNSISSVAPDPNDEDTVRPRPKKRGWGLKKKESGRLESAPSDDKAPSRDGLHSAPSGDTAAKQDQMTSPSKVMDRGGLHSAPPDRKSVAQSASTGAPAVVSEAPKPALSEFLVEGVSGVSAADADTYCADILGAPLQPRLLPSAASAASAAP